MERGKKGRGLYTQPVEGRSSNGSDSTGRDFAK